MNSLDFVDCFLGGPCDGVRRPGEQEVDFPIFVGHELAESDSPLTAVYEYVGNREGHGCVERVYRFFESMAPAEGRSFLAEHGSLTGFTRLRG